MLNEFKGLFTTRDATLIPDKYLSNSLNITCADGLIAPLKQYSTFGNQLTGDDYAGRILSSFTAQRTDGIEVPVRLRDDDTNTHLEWYNSVNKTWETLLPDLTTAKPMAFVGFNTATQDGAYLCNGVMNYSFWTIAHGSVKSNTATVITLNETSAATQGFSATGGTVIVNIAGTVTEKTYTGVSGATITGLSGLGTITADKGVAEAVDDSTYSTLPKFEKMVVADGRIWGAVADSVRLYYSKVGDGTDYTVSTSPDDPGTRDFIEGEGPISGLAVIKENIIVFKKDLVRLYKLDYPSSTTRVSISKELRRGDSVGAVNQEGIETIGESIYYFTPKGGIKSISLSKLTDEFDFQDETDLIRPTLKEGVFTSSRLVYWEKEKRLLGAFKKNSDSAYNDRVVMIEFTRKIDGTLTKKLGILDWFVNAWFKYAGNLYFGGSFEPNCFKAFDGWQKGTANAPYTALFTTKRFRFDKSPSLQKEISYLLVDGWILANKLYFQLDYNYLGTLAHIKTTFDPVEDTQYIIQPEVNTLGAFEIGSEPVGGLMTDIGDLNYFRIYFTLPPRKNPTDIQLTVYSSDSGSRWKLSSLAFLVKDAEMSVPKKLKKSFN